MVMYNYETHANNCFRDHPSSDMEVRCSRASRKCAREPCSQLATPEPRKLDHGLTLCEHPINLTF
jgi:hypothetical protein